MEPSEPSEPSEVIYPAACLFVTVRFLDQRGSPGNKNNNTNKQKTNKQIAQDSVLQGHKWCYIKSADQNE